MLKQFEAGIFLVILTLVSPMVAVAACHCGPNYCTDDPRINTNLADKKKAMTDEYPKRLLSLLDKGAQCVARIDQEPDIFSFVFIYADGSIITHPWSQDDEALAQKELASGKLKRYWIVNGRRAFSCCDEKTYDKMDDYDANDDVNASRAIKCVKGNAC